MNVKSDLREINARVCRRLWDVIDIGGKPGGLTPRLVIPHISGSNVNGSYLRISEQEARFIFCSEIENTNYYYSVETPTEQKYSFNGNTKISARSDISLYLIDGAAAKLVHQVNVELKANNPEEKSIEKDIEKLFVEQSAVSGLEGNWFHLLKNVDNGNLTKLLGKFKSSLPNFRSKSSTEIDSVSILFVFCVLEKKWACMKQFEWDPSKGDFDAYTHSFFDLKYRVVNPKIITEKDDLNGWEIIERN